MVGAGAALEIVRVLIVQLVTGAGNNEVDAGGEQGPGGDVSFTAAALIGDQEPLDCCEEDAGQLSGHSFHIDAGGVPTGWMVSPLRAERFYAQ